MNMARTDGTARQDAVGRLSRRTAMRLVTAGALAGAVPAGPGPNRAAARGTATPASGEAVSDLAGFDQVMTDLMAKWDLPGGQLAVARDGKLVLNRGYGLADRETGEAVQPESLFRIASVSKAVTAVAFLELVDDGLLALDDKAFPLLDLEPPANAPVDPRLADITIEHLLVHAGGWDSGASFEAQDPPWSGLAAVILGDPQPSSAETIVRFMVGMRLDFDPGSKSVYSNFGFNVLGRVIERVSGMSYEDFTQSRVLMPAGVKSASLARTRREDRAPGEVLYYGPAGQGPLPSVFPGEGFAPVAYGAYALESFDAHGGWITSAADLARFATAVDGQRGMSLLTPVTVEAMLRTPRPSPNGAEPTFGLGWDTVPGQDGVGWSHAGGLIGSTASWLERTADGLTIAFVFNSQPENAGSFFPEAVTTLRAAAAAVRAWPAHDLFST